MRQHRRPRSTFVNQAKMIDSLPGWDPDQPAEPSQMDLVRLIQQQLADQGLETMGQMFELLGLHNLGYDIEDPEIVAKAVFLGELQQRRQTKREEMEAARPIREPNIYYARIQNLIKIGYTTRPLKRRMTELMADEVLAIEPGGAELESLRHKQFAHLRYRGERFYPGTELMSHIDMIKDHFRDHQKL